MLTEFLDDIQKAIWMVYAMEIDAYLDRRKDDF